MCFLDGHKLTLSPHRKQTLSSETSKAINKLLKPYKDKMATLGLSSKSANRTMYSSFSTNTSTNFSSKKSLYTLNSASYTHMSGLRNTVSIFSLRTVTEKLLSMVEKFKDLEIKVVKYLFTKKDLWRTFENAVMTQFKEQPNGS